MKKLNSLFARKIVSFCKCYLDNFELLQAGIIGKYHIQVMLLFLCNRSWEIFGYAQETFISLWLKKQTQASAFITTFLRQWKKEGMDSFLWKVVQTIKGKQHEGQWKYFQIIAFANFSKKLRDIRPVF